MKLLQTVIALTLSTLVAHVGAVQRRLRSKESVLNSVDATTTQHGTLKVAMVTWNVAESLQTATPVNADKALVAAFTKALTDDPEVLAFAYQENLKSASDTIAILQTAVPTLKNDYKVDEEGRAERRNNVATETGHGNSGIVVFRKKVNSKLTEECKPGVRSNYRKALTKSNEKGVTSVDCQFGDVKICFASTHSDPAKWFKKEVRDNSRVLQFTKYANMLEGTSKNHDNDHCDYVFYGGDFNWRNSDWKWFTKGETRNWRLKKILGPDGKKKHAHFSDTDVTSWINGLNLNGFVQATVNNNEVPATLLGTAGTAGGVLQLDTDERTTRPTGWLEGPGQTSTAQLSMPPTFQPAECPTDLQHFDQPQTPSNPANNKDQTAKSALCFKVQSGGNCVQTQTRTQEFLCLSAQRPVCWTDAIYHRKLLTRPGHSVRNTAYGPVIKPTASDHFPVVGAYAIQTPKLKRRNAILGSETPSQAISSIS